MCCVWQFWTNKRWTWLPRWLLGRTHTTVKDLHYPDPASCRAQHRPEAPTVGEVVWMQGWDEEKASEKYGQKFESNFFFWNLGLKNTINWTPSTKPLWGHRNSLHFRMVKPLGFREVRKLWSLWLWLSDWRRFEAVVAWKVGFNHPWEKHHVVCFFCLFIVFFSLVVGEVLWTEWKIR